MLSINKVGASRIEYYLKLAREDYYTKGGEPPGYWLGAGAKALGLEGKLEPAAFRNLMNGLSPDGKRHLTQRQNYTNTHAGCGKKRHRQAGWDCTVSVPKPVSVAWAVAPPEIQHAIDAAIAVAVEGFVDYLQRNAAFTRRGKGGSELEQAKVVVSAFPHSTSRALDPQRHVHCIFHNIAVRGSDHSTGTLLSKPLFRQKMAAGAVFRRTLACELEKIGFVCEPTRHAFQIRGIPEELCRHFSKRRQAIVERLEELGQSSAADASRATLETRPPKGEVPPREWLLRYWQAQAMQFGVTPETIRNLTAQGRAVPPQPTADKREQAQSSEQRHEQARTDRTDVSGTRPGTEAGASGQRQAESKRGHGADRQRTGNAFKSRADRGHEASHSPKCPSVVGRIGRSSLDRRYVISDKVMESVLRKYGHVRNAYLQELHHDVRRIVKSALHRETQYVPHEVHVQQAGLTLDRDGQAVFQAVTRRFGRVIVLGSPHTCQRDLALRAAREAWEKSGYKVMICAPQRVVVNHLARQTGVPGMAFRRLELKMHPALGFQVRHHLRQFGRAIRGRQTYRLERLRVGRGTVLIVDRPEHLKFDELSRLVRDVERQGGKLVLMTPLPDDVRREAKDPRIANLLWEPLDIRQAADISGTAKTDRDHSMSATAEGAEHGKVGEQREREAQRGSRAGNSKSRKARNASKARRRSSRDSGPCPSDVRRIGRSSLDRRYVVSDKIMESVLLKYSRSRNAFAQRFKHDLRQIARSALRRETQRVPQAVHAEQARLTLDRDARAVLRAVTRRTGRVIVLGSPHTSQRDLALRAAREAWERSGYKVIVCAPQRGATNHLARQMGVPGASFRRMELLMHPTLGFQVGHHLRQLNRAVHGKTTYRLKQMRVDRGTVLVVDRPEQLQFAELSRLVQDIERQGAKLVLLTPPPNVVRREAKDLRTANLLWGHSGHQQGQGVSAGWWHADPQHQHGMGPV